MGMKYYAKSKKKGLSDKERGKQIKEPEEEQKTLNSHQEDIVRCAEAFFEEYGRYFSEKEKRLVIEACRIHDWGKANLVFHTKQSCDKICRRFAAPVGFVSPATGSPPLGGRARGFL